MTFAHVNLRRRRQELFSEYWELLLHLALAKGDKHLPYQKINLMAGFCVQHDILNVRSEGIQESKRKEGKKNDGVIIHIHIRREYAEG